MPKYISAKKDNILLRLQNSKPEIPQQAGYVARTPALSSNNPNTLDPNIPKNLSPKPLAWIAASELKFSFHKGHI